MTETIDRVIGTLGFSEPLPVRMKYHANDTSRDVMNVVPRAVPIENARTWHPAPRLDEEGFALFPHASALRDFRNAEDVARIYAAEVEALLRSVTGADDVVINGPGLLRFGEKSKDSGALNNSRPARFVHIDSSDVAVAGFRERLSVPEGRGLKRVVHYNVWRALTPPPQDVPLALCDARSLAAGDLIPADAMFDRDGDILFSFEGLVLRHNPAQRWAYFADMTPDEALIFKTNDSDPAHAHHVPHGAFDDPSCPADTPPRASIEMRATALWYA